MVGVWLGKMGQLITASVRTPGETNASAAVVSNAGSRSILLSMAQSTKADRDLSHMNTASKLKCGESRDEQCNQDGHRYRFQHGSSNAETSEKGRDRGANDSGSASQL